MKIIKNFLIFIFSLIFIFTIALNLFLFFSKNRIIENFNKYGYKAKYDFFLYLFPNNGLVKNFSFSSENLDCKFKTIFLSFDILKTFKEKRLHLSVYRGNGVLLQLSTKKHSVEYEFPTINIEFLPNKLFITNAKIITDKIVINDVEIRLVRKDDKVNVVLNGDVSNYKISLNFDTDVEKKLWYLKSNFFPNSECVSMNLLPKINFEIFGNYDFNKFKQYKLSLYPFGNKIISKGKIKFYPFQVESDIEGDLLRGSIVVYKKDEMFFGDYKGEVDLSKLFANFSSQKALIINSQVYFNFSSRNYKILAKLYTPSFLADIFLEDNKGTIKIFPKNIFKRIILSDIKYEKDKKVLNIKSRDKRYPFDFNLSFNQIRDFNLYGNFLGSELSGKFLKSEDKTEANLYLKSKIQKVVFSYLKEKSYIVGDLELNNYSKKIYLKGNISKIQDSDTFNFNLECKNFPFGSRNRLSFISSGNIEKNFCGSFSIRDVYYKEQKIVDLINGEFSLVNNLVNIKFCDEKRTISGEFKYHFKDNFYDGVLSIKNLLFNVDKISFLLSLDLKFNNKEKLKIEGDYVLSEIFYNKENLKLYTNGRFIFKNNNKIEFLGGLKTDNKQKICSYSCIFDFKKEALNINIRDFALTDEDKFNAEVIIARSFDNKNKKYQLLYSGKIYNEDSEVIIFPSFISSDFDTIKLNSRIKNFCFKNNNFVGSLELLINGLSEDIINCKLNISEFWVNMNFFDKGSVNLSYDKKNKILIFSPIKENKTDMLAISGEVSFPKKDRINFKNFKIYKEKQYLLINGNLGIENDVIQIKFLNIPLEVIKGMLGITKPSSSGMVDGELVLTTVSKKDKLYKIKSNFLIKDALVEDLKIPQIVGKIFGDTKEVVLDEVSFNFKEQQKFVITGRYNIISKICDFELKSYKCDLSMFNDFYDIIKSAEGIFFVDLKIKGKINSPQITGYFNLPKGNIKFKKYLSYLDNVSIKLNFLNSKIIFEKFVGYYKNTKLLVSGFWDLLEEANLKVYTEGGKGIFVSIPELSFPVGEFFQLVKNQPLLPSNGEVELNLNIRKQKDMPFVEGKVLLNNTHFTYPGVAKKESKESFTLKDFYYDITIVAKDNVWYENEYISANIIGSVNLKYTKDTDKTDVNGEATALSGIMKFFNTNFRIKSGNIELIKSIPYLEMVGETDIVSTGGENIKVQLVIDRAKVEDIKPRLVSPSHPTLKNEDLIAMLLGVGRLAKSEKNEYLYVLPKEQLDYTSLLKAQFVKLIDSSLATPIARNILQRWGIVDNVTVSYIPTGVAEQKQSSSMDNTQKISLLDIFKNTKYGLEKYITSDMLIGYSIALAEYQQKLNLKHEIEIGYRLKGGLFIKGIYDYGIRDYNTGRYGGDVKIQLEPTFRLKSWEEEEKGEKK